MDNKVLSPLWAGGLHSGLHSQTYPIIVKTFINKIINQLSTINFEGNNYMVYFTCTCMFNMAILDQSKKEIVFLQHMIFFVNAGWIKSETS